MSMEWKYVKQTTADKINYVEKCCEIHLPEDLKEFILQYNNGRPIKSTFDSERTKGLEIKKLLSYNEDDKESIYTFLEVIRSENKSLFPVASEPAGDFICLDTSNNKIVHYNHETTSIEFISNSFSEFIKKLY